MGIRQCAVLCGILIGRDCGIGGALPALHAEEGVVRALRLLLHLWLVATLMIVFPFSKLLHAPGLFFSPTRNQVDNPREKRHIANWAKSLEQ